MATGEKAGTWGTLTNTNWDIIEQIAGAYTTQTITDGNTIPFTGGTGITAAVSAVDTLLDGKSNIMIGISHSQITTVPFSETIKSSNDLDLELVRVADIVST